MTTLKVEVIKLNNDRVIKKLIKTNSNYTVTLSNLSGLIKGYSFSHYGNARLKYALL